MSEVKRSYVKCPDCHENAPLVRLKNFARHAKEVHGHTEPPQVAIAGGQVLCPKCQVFVREDRLKRHIAKVHGVPHAQNSSGHSQDFITDDQLQRINAILAAAKRREFTFLLMGRTGVGKSSTINHLLGSTVAKVGEFEPQTMEVKSYRTKIQDVPCLVVDTPGLCDDLPEYGNDRRYIEQVRAAIPNIDALWFVTRLDETRVGADEKRGISLITEAFGNEVWQRAIVIFTHADKLTPRDFPRYVSKRTQLIRQEIGRHTDRATADLIPAVAVSNISIMTPDGKMWMGELYTRVFTRMEAQGALPFLMATAHRIVTMEQVAAGRDTEIEVRQMVVEARKILDDVKQAAIEGQRNTDKIIIVQPPEQYITIENNPPPIIIDQKQESDLMEHAKKALPDIIVDVVSRGLDLVGTAVGGFAGAVSKAASTAVKFLGRLFRRQN